MKLNSFKLENVSCDRELSISVMQRSAGTNRPLASKWSPIMEKMVDKLCLIQEKKKPLSPNAMLIQVILSEASPDPPTLF